MTDHNPYTPPSAAIAEDQSVAPEPPKPWAQLPKRSQPGRWIGVILLLVALAGVIYLVFTTDPSIMQSPGQLAGFIFNVVVTFVPIAWLLYAFAFSRKARAYFRGTARN